MLARSILVVLWLSAPAHARLGGDVLDALVPLESGPPWLERVDDCRDAGARAATPFLPFECMPPAAVTLGFARAGAEVAALESDRYPGCGEVLPRYLDRRAPGAARPLSRVALFDEGGVLALALTRMWAALRELTTGFAPPVRAITAEAKVDKGDASQRVAVVLGPPLAGWLVHLDPVGRQVELIGPTGASHRLIALPRMKAGTLPSIWDVAVSPDAQWIVLRLAALAGNPCDPAELQRLDVKVPAPARVPLGQQERWSFDERACLRDADLEACTRRCEADPRRCAEVARLVVESERARAARLFQEACDAGNGEACNDMLRRRLGDREEVFSKSGDPPWLIELRAKTRRALKTACDAGDVESCLRILRRNDALPWRPRYADRKAAKESALRVLRAECARNEAVCERVRQVQQIPID